MVGVCAINHIRDPHDPATVCKDNPPPCVHPLLDNTRDRGIVSVDPCQSLWVRVCRQRGHDNHGEGWEVEKVVNEPSEPCGCVANVEVSGHVVGPNEDGGDVRTIGGHRNAHLGRNGLDYETRPTFSVFVFEGGSDSWVVPDHVDDVAIPLEEVVEIIAVAIALAASNAKSDGGYSGVRSDGSGFDKGEIYLPPSGMILQVFPENERAL